MQLVNDTSKNSTSPPPHLVKNERSLRNCDAASLERETLEFDIKQVDMDLISILKRKRSRHFNLPNHSTHNMTICGLSPHHGNTESHNNLEQNSSFNSALFTLTESMNAFKPQFKHTFFVNTEKPKKKKNFPEQNKEPTTLTHTKPKPHWWNASTE